MIAYKALDARGRSPVRKFDWPRPRGGRPGKWVTVEGRPVLCQHGLHGWKSLDYALEQGAMVFEMEIDGEIVEDGQKIAGTRARLLRRLDQNTVYGEVIEWGVFPCDDCGKQHALRRTGPKSQSWADPDDEHPYRHYGHNEKALITKLIGALGYTPETIDWSPFLPVDNR